MRDEERLAIAGLLHDLPALFESTQTALPAEAQRLLALARPEDAALPALLREAEGFTLRENSTRQLVTDRPLLSIFSRLQLPKEDEEAGTPEAPEPPARYQRIAPLSETAAPQETIFPVAEADASRLGEHLRALAEELAWLARAVPPDDFPRLYHHLLALLLRFGWCLPAHDEDVALVDHARLTSAVAVCLYHARTWEPEAGEAPAEPLCLVVGDLSGIQDYIFGIANIGAGGVARRLRGRSFYLSALADALSHQAAFHFGVPLGNVIMASGGKFYLLAPNRGDAQTALDALRVAVDRWFRQQFNAEIAVNLAALCFAPERLRAGSLARPGFGDVIGALGARLAREKQRRGRGVLLSGGAWDEAAFVVERDFRGAGACVSCRKLPARETDGICDQCERDVEVGRGLLRARYVAFYRDAAGEIPLPLGGSARLLEEGELPSAGQPYLLLKLNNPKLRELAAYPAASRSLANHVPREGNGDVQLSFDKIAGRAEGRALLGYLKADLDSLGILFAQGLRDDRGGYDTAAHVAALSRQLDLFFSGWVQHLLDRTPDYQNFYTIFSGGDDLFLVGPWDRAAELGVAVRAGLAAFVGHNPAVTLSAGVLFTKERYPIWRAADDAEEVLELSKEREWPDEPGRTRNQLTILGDTMRWEAAPAIFREIETLQARSQHLTSAFLYDLVEYARLYNEMRAGKIEGLRYKALFAYNIARNLRRGDAELYTWADGLLQSLNAAPDNPTVEHLGLIATYVLFARRARSQD